LKYVVEIKEINVIIPHMSREGFVNKGFINRGVRNTNYEQIAEQQGYTTKGLKNRNKYGGNKNKPLNMKFS